MSRSRAAALTGLAVALAASTARAGEDPSSALARLSHPPLGLPALQVPATNPPFESAIVLGRKLFYDERLSSNGRTSCATCHKPQQAFTETATPTPAGADGTPLARNAPSLINAAYMTHLMHDGEGHSLETQILAPLFLLNEMGNASIAGFVARVAALPEYAGAFGVAFGEPPSIGAIGKALASYERTLLSGNSPFDRWRFGGDEAALMPEAKAGFALFTGKARCSVCHTVGEHDALFTDQDFHNTGIGAKATPDPTRNADLGREAVTHDPADRYKYRTPTLRTVARSAPYMHDGSLATLEAVVRFYNAGGASNPGLDPAIQPLDLTDAEIASLVTFLDSLTGDNLDTLAREAAAP